MKEYIEKEATIKRFTFATLDCLGMEPQIRASDVVKAIDAIPAADVVEVRHGRWDERIVDDECDKYGFFRRRFYCSACGDWTTYGETNYCPNCGAKMDGGVNDGAQV